MSDNPIYTNTLVDATSMSSAAPLADSTMSFQPVFDGPGTATFVVPIDSSAAYKARKRSTAVLLNRNGRDIWSAPVVSVSHDGEASKTTITASGWLEEYDHRYVRQDEVASLTFTSGTDTGGDIYGALIAMCNLQEDTDGNVRPLRLTFGGGSDTQVRTRSYKVGDSYGASMRELVEIEDGCDLAFDYRARKVFTRPPDAFVVRAIELGYNVEPFNLANCVLTDDGTQLANRETVINSGGVIQAFDDQEGINAAGVMLEEWLTLSDVADPTIAAAFANAELIYKRLGVVTYQLTPPQFGDFPRPYDDFEWGDQATLSASKGAMSVKGQPVRIFAGTIALDPQGNEIISEYQVALA